MDGTISPVWFQLSPLLAHAKGIVALLSPWCKRGICKSFQLPGPFTVPSWPSFFFLWQSLRHGNTGRCMDLLFKRLSDPVLELGAFYSRQFE